MKKNAPGLTGEWWCTSDHASAQTRIREKGEGGKELGAFSKKVRGRLAREIEHMFTVSGIVASGGDLDLSASVVRRAYGDNPSSTATHVFVKRPCGQLSMKKKRERKRQSQAGNTVEGRGWPVM